MRFNLSTLNLRAQSRIIATKFAEHAAVGLRSLLQRRTRRRVYTGLALCGAGAYCYQQFIGNNLEVVYTPNDYNNALIGSIESIASGKYPGSPTLFLRFMEIIYGNTLDRREKTEYVREIIHAPDAENLALGRLSRLEEL